MNKSIFITAIFYVVSVVSMAQDLKRTDDISYNPNAKGDTSKRSIKSAAVGKIGSANVTISYHSPGVRKRIIWGGLVPNGEVWVTGAHSATTLETDKSFTIGDTRISAGKYALFTIPGKDEWIIIINKNWEQHLTDDYNLKDDVVRIKVKPEQLNENVERLQYFIEDKKGGKGTIAVAWEKVKVEFSVIIKS